MTHPNDPHPVNPSRPRADDFEWLRSSSCSSGACVQVARAGQVVLVQDSKKPASGGGQMQAWTVPEWCGLVAAVASGADHPAIDFLPSGHVRLGFTYGARHEVLVFDAAEWHAFTAGVKAGEFDIDELSSPAAGQGLAAAGRQAGHGSAAVPGHQAATGAGEPGMVPAPVAAPRRVMLPTNPPKWSERPAFSGPNVASMNVPAGRLGDPMSPIPPQEAGRPGLNNVPAGRGHTVGSTTPGASGVIVTSRPAGAPQDSDSARRAAREAVRHAFYEGVREVGYDLVDVLGRCTDAAVDAFLEAVIREAAAPLTKHISDSLHGERPVGSGEAGPGSHPRGSGPAEPAERAS